MGTQTVRRLSPQHRDLREIALESIVAGGAWATYKDGMSAHA